MAELPLHLTFKWVRLGAKQLTRVRDPPGTSQTVHATLTVGPAAKGAVALSVTLLAETVAEYLYVDRIHLLEHDRVYIEAYTSDAQGRVRESSLGKFLPEDAFDLVVMRSKLTECHLDVHQTLSRMTTAFHTSQDDAADAEQRDLQPECRACLVGLSAPHEQSNGLQVELLVWQHRHRRWQVQVRDDKRKSMDGAFFLVQTAHLQMVGGGGASTSSGADASGRPAKVPRRR